MTDSPIQESIQQLLQLIQNFVNGQTMTSMGASTKLPKVAPPSVYNGDWMKLDKFLSGTMRTCTKMLPRNQVVIKTGEQPQ